MQPLIGRILSRNIVKLNQQLWINGKLIYIQFIIYFQKRNDDEIALMRIGGNKNHLDLLSQYYPPEEGLVTLQQKYKSKVSDFYRKLVS